MLGQSRMTQRYLPQVRDDEAPLTRRVIELAALYGRYRQPNGRLRGSTKDLQRPRHLLQGVVRCEKCGSVFKVALHEKGGKEHAVPCHHKVEAFLDDYLAAGRNRR